MDKGTQDGVKYIVIAVLFFVWAAGSFMIFKHEEADFYERLGATIYDQVDIIHRYADTSMVIVDIMRKQLEVNIRLAEGGRLQHAALAYMKDYEAIQSYGIDATVHALTGEEAIDGSLTGLGSHTDLPLVVRQEIEAALSLKFYFGDATSYSPDFIWAYYTSTKGFMLLAPAVSIQDFHFHQELYNKPFWVPAIPENNPDRAIVLSELYEDGAGKGNMISISAPVYVNETFRGVVSIDIGLAELQKSLLFGHPPGESILSNPQGMIIAAPFEFATGDILSQSSQLHYSSFTVGGKKFSRAKDERYEYFLAPILPGEMNLIHRLEILQGQKLVLQATLIPVLIHSLFLLTFFLLYRIISSRNTLQVAFENLRTTQQQLIQSEKMAALGQLIAGIAHEINTPIGAIQSSGGNIDDSLSLALHSLPQLFRELSSEEQDVFIRLVQRSQDNTRQLSTREERKIVRSLCKELKDAGIEESRHVGGILVQLNAEVGWQEFIPILTHVKSESILQIAYSIATIFINTENINQAVKRVSKIVYALKSFSRFDSSGEKVETDVTEGIETVLTIYHNQIKHGIELIKNYQDIPAISCYPDELNQVWTNLVHNALQAMSYSGVLKIDVYKADQYVHVSIADTGCGISPEIQDKIFDPFFTTKAAGEGSGLGLDIVKKIIEKHKGKITIESTVNTGTIFTVSLPMVDVGGEAS